MTLFDGSIEKNGADPVSQCGFGENEPLETSGACAMLQILHRSAVRGHRGLRQGRTAVNGRNGCVAQV